MKIATCGVLLLFSGAFHAQAQSRHDHWSVVRAEQLSNHEKFAASVEWTRNRLMEVGEFTQLLMENSNLEQMSKGGGFDTYGLPADTTVVFKVRVGELDKYSILDWIVQNISFPNSMLRIAGYGLVSRAEILRLKVENAKLANAPADSTQKLELQYLEAQKALDEYLATQRWVD